MPVKVTLEEASVEIGLITTLDAKMTSLQDSLFEEKGRLETNQSEIKKRLELEAITPSIEAKIKSLQKEIRDIKTQRDDKVAGLTSAGWVIPIPKNNGPRASVSM